MSPRFDPVQSDTSLPPRTSVVVIGGGIVGTSTALFLAEKGIPVVLCEKGQVGGEQSGRNWGWTRVMGRDLREIPLGLESLKLWRRMNQITGAETGFRQAGISYFCLDDKAVAEREAWLDMARPFQIDSRMIGPDEISELYPGLVHTYKAALYTPSDGRAEPTKAPAAIAEAARKLGAKVFTQCAVRGIETKGGRVGGVVTEKGRIDCDSVVLAGGAWSRLFGGSLGIHHPALNTLSSVFRSTPVDGPEIAGSGAGFSFRKRLDGGYSIALRDSSVADITPDSFRLFFDFVPHLINHHSEFRLRLGRRFFEELTRPRSWSLDAPTVFEQPENRVLDPKPVQRYLEEARRRFIAAFPKLPEIQIAESWGGLIDATPDAVPVISPVDKLPGFFLASGFSGHGFGIGPGAGKLAADLIAGDTPAVDPKPYRHNRFLDGTWRDDRKAANLAA
jgi:glycine/D-amino acid oxidase-like deaminating enzyme